MAVFALPCFAQYEQELTYEPETVWVESASYQDGAYFDNPCTATVDWAWYTYDLNVQQEGKEMVGGLDLLFDEQTTISGSYSVAGSSQSDVTYGEEPLEIRKYRRANAYDQFHLVTVMRFDPITRETTLSMEAVCGNGMPDSLE